MSAALVFDRVGVDLGKRRILDDVSLTLAPGNLVVLVGPNGAGKTTLLRAALGLHPLSGGRIELDGREVRAWTGRERAARVAWLPQHTSLREHVRVLDLVAAARFRFVESRSRSEVEAGRALERVGASDLATRSVLRLSGGEQQRVAIAALLAQEAPLLLLDEPANHLDPSHQIEIYELIGRLRRSGLGVLCVTHDLNLVSHALESPTTEENDARVLGLARGRIEICAPFGSPALAAELARLFGVQVEAVTWRDQRRFLFARVTEQGAPR